MSYFPQWKLKKDGVIAPDERLPTGQTLALGVQHVVAMFGSTILAPLLMGFDPNVAILMSGIGTLIFFFIVGGHVPSYLGSSFAFIGVVIAATGYSAGSGLNANIGVALGGIIACGLIYAIVGLIVMSTGVKWIEKLMPPVVTGAVVAVIGLNLAPTACKSVGDGTFNACIAIITMVCVGAVAVYTRGLIQKLLILVGIALSYVIYFILRRLLLYSIYPIFFSPKVLENDNLPKNAEPTRTAFKCIYGNFTNADELHICNIPVCISFIFKISITSINLLN